MYHSEGSDRSHETGNKEVEDDEDPWPAKRRKLRSATAHEGLAPQPQNLTPPSATQLEVTLEHASHSGAWYILPYLYQDIWLDLVK
jgi:hypothetical protein